MRICYCLYFTSKTIINHCFDFWIERMSRIERNAKKRDNSLYGWHQNAKYYRFIREWPLDTIFRRHFAYAESEWYKWPFLFFQTDSLSWRHRFSTVLLLIHLARIEHSQNRTNNISPITFSKTSRHKVENLNERNIKQKEIPVEPENLKNVAQPSYGLHH